VIRKTKPLTLGEAKAQAQAQAQEKAPEMDPKEALYALFPDPEVSTPSEPLESREKEAFLLPYEPPSFDFKHAAQSPEQELAQRELCRRRLLPFIQRFRPKYNAGWVHADICRRLERFVRQVEAGEEPRLLLMCPPRSGKSEIGSRHLAPWVLGQHPEWEIIAASHTSSLSMSFSRYVRDLMRNPAYSAVFPDAVLDPSSQSTENWNLTKGGGYLAAGVGTGITGRGAHVLLLDDLVKDIEAADSITIRDNTWEWYLSTAYTRLAPGGGVIGIMCMTGDTPVRLANGNEQRLDTLTPSTPIATYRNGVLSTSTVAAVKSSGRDLVFKITTSSGRIVRANGRHPFLTLTPSGELVWTRTRGLTTAHRIVALKGSGTNTKASSAQSKVVGCQLSVEGCAPVPTTRSAGQMVTAASATAQNLAATLVSSIATVLQPLTTTLCTQLSKVLALFAKNPASVSPNTGRTNLPLTTAMTRVGYEGYCVTTATQPLDTLELSRWHSLPPHTSDFTPDEILSIEPDGEEEVFDVQVDQTENFIANGLVSHNTWWHDDDWAGRIQQSMNAGDGDKFEIVRYPAINEYGDEYVLEDDTIVEIPPDSLVPTNARKTRPLGTAIHPARYSTEAMLRIKKNLIAGGQKRVWDALYQQNPIPDEGNFFSKEMFRYYTTPPARTDLFVYQAWDFAISEGKESDYTVGVCIGQDHYDSLYVLDIRRFRSGDGGYIIDEILDFAATWDADVLGFEDGQIWKAIEFQFQKRCDERKQYPSHELLKPLTDKMVRANPLKGRMQLGKVFFDKNAPWFTELHKEFLHFPAGKHDDQVDGMAWSIRLTLSRAAPKREIREVKMKSWRDRLKNTSAGDTSYMAA
jgi:predicted phage terminase large subunit-like protein